MSAREVSQGEQLGVAAWAEYLQQYGEPINGEPIEPGQIVAARRVAPDSMKPGSTPTLVHCVERCEGDRIYVARVRVAAWLNYDTRSADVNSWLHKVSKKSKRLAERDEFQGFILIAELDQEFPPGFPSLLDRRKLRLLVQGGDEGVE